MHVVCAVMRTSRSRLESLDTSYVIESQDNTHDIPRDIFRDNHDYLITSKIIKHIPTSLCHLAKKCYIITKQ